MTPAPRPPGPPTAHASAYDRRTPNSYAQDPVTGSAHCALKPWWQSRLGRGSRLFGFQVRSEPFEA